MTDAEFLFQESIREKRGMVNGARHTKGKMKRNGTPRDLNVSEKEYKEKCGQVQKFNLSMPLKLNEFNELPQDLKKEYFRRLVEILHMNREIISMMMGCSYATIFNLMKRCGYVYPVIRGKRFAQYHDDWRNFFNRDERFTHLMDNFDKVAHDAIKDPAEKTSETPETTQVSDPELVKETPAETTQVSVQEATKKIPEIMSMAIRIYANSYDELISQLESMKGQPILGQTLTIEVVKG